MVYLDIFCGARERFEEGEKIGRDRAGPHTKCLQLHVMDIKNSTPIAVAVAMSAPDVESQEPKEVMEENTTMIDDDDNAGKGMGIAMFVLIIVGLNIAALVLASVLTCGCCCVKQYNLKPHVKKMATATLITLYPLVRRQYYICLGLGHAPGGHV